MAFDDWQLFLDNLKRDTSIASRLHKVLGERGESKNGEFRDSVNSRFQNLCQNKELIREKNKKKQKKDENVEMKLASTVPPRVATRGGFKTTKSSLGKKE